MSDKIELKPCPFCGGEGELNWDMHYDAPDCGGERRPEFDSFSVKCKRCHFELTSDKNHIEFRGKMSAIAAWNTRHEATEPKDCGFTLATCPYERCSGITMRDPKAEEPLAVKEPHIICLAAAKHYRIRPAMTAKAWIISLVKIGDRNDKFVAKGETYWEAERQARAFLMGLPDKGDTK
jgi:hypothetical protein